MLAHSSLQVLKKFKFVVEYLKRVQNSDALTAQIYGIHIITLGCRHASISISVLRGRITRSFGIFLDRRTQNKISIAAALRLPTSKAIGN
jgi:hypothetical protein